jgi:tetratricopeptide (TPR) repeat protein
VPAGSLRGRKGANGAECGVRAYQLDASDRNAVNVGWIYQSMAGDWYRAAAYYEKGLQFADKDPSLYYQLGLCYEALRNAPKAVEYYHLFLRAAPNHKYADDARFRLSALGG